jgi:murein DD-endopeptidase MepM/ murein hydrolase activator NlpD
MVAGLGWAARDPLLPRAVAADAEFDTYVVKRGDTLSEIAEKHGISLSQLRALNGIRSDHILPGQRLRVGRGESYPLLAPIRSKIAVPNLNRARWKHIIVHHSATSTGNAAIFDRYHREQRHMENGLAYHFIIGNGSNSEDGEIEVGGRWTRQLNGGHVRSYVYNDNSVGICLVGNFEQTRPTRKQIAAALELVEFIRTDLLHGKPDILFHREIRGEHTLCPGRNFPVTRFRQSRA